MFLWQQLLDDVFESYFSKKAPKCSANEIFNLFSKLIQQK